MVLLYNVAYHKSWKGIQLKLEGEGGYFPFFETKIKKGGEGQIETPTTSSAP